MIFVIDMIKHHSNQKNHTKITVQTKRQSINKSNKQIKKESSMKKNHLRLLTVAAMLSVTISLSAQVRIGGRTPSTPGSLLDLNSPTTGTVLFPHVSIDDLDRIPDNIGVTNQDSLDVNYNLTGSIVFNINSTTGIGLYLWDGEYWLKIDTATKPEPPFDPSTLPPGSGSFSGKFCFDIADGNDGDNECGSLANRESLQTVFADRTEQDGAAALYSGVQVYTFTPPASTSVSHVRFHAVETADISSIDSIVPKGAYSTADNINTACKVTVYYKSS
jgi:hypothetical protein